MQSSDNQRILHRALWIGGVIIIGCELLPVTRWLYAKLKNSSLRSILAHYLTNRDANHAYMYKTIFFPVDKLPCRLFFNLPNICDRKYCPYTHERNGINDILDLISSANATVDVCIHMFTTEDIAQSIIRCFERGIRVRVIVDDGMGRTDRSQSGPLRAAGIAVRSNKHGYLMHHKFLIIDSKVLLNGSLNWTQQGFLANNENVVITDNTQIVQPFVNEFEKLWTQFDPSAKVKKDSKPLPFMTHMARRS